MAQVEIKRILSGFNLGSPMQLQSHAKPETSATKPPKAQTLEVVRAQTPETPKSSAGLLPLFTCSNNPASVGSGWRFRLAGSDSVGLRQEVFWV